MPVMMMQVDLERKKRRITSEQIKTQDSRLLREEDTGMKYSAARGAEMRDEIDIFTFAGPNPKTQK